MEYHSQLVLINAGLNETLLINYHGASCMQANSAEWQKKRSIEGEGKERKGN